MIFWILLNKSLHNTVDQLQRYFYFGNWLTKTFTQMCYCVTRASGITQPKSISTQLTMWTWHFACPNFCLSLFSALRNRWKHLRNFSRGCFGTLETPPCACVCVCIYTCVRETHYFIHVHIPIYAYVHVLFETIWTCHPVLYRYLSLCICSISLFSHSFSYI